MIPLSLKNIDEKIYSEHFLKNYNIDVNIKFVLITGHRRENFGDGFVRICNSIRELSLKYPEINFIYPVHLNPNVKQVVYKTLVGIKNIILIKPLEYFEFIFLLSKSFIILTDSGGIQEEAPSLDKPVLVMRNTTERPEAIEHGKVKLVGTDENKIISEVTELIENTSYYNSFLKKANPYGDGTASVKIVNFLKILCMYKNRINLVENYIKEINLKSEILEKLSDKNILVVGGAGAIGSNLIIALSKLVGNGKVIVLDNLSSIKIKDPWNVTPMSNIMFIEGDLRSDIDLKRVFKENIDIVYHLAAFFANQNSVDYPEISADVDVLGHIKLLEYSRLAKVEKFIYASSGCAIYGSYEITIKRRLYINALNNSLPN